MSCYILSPKGVRKLLEVASPIPTTDPLDVFLRCQFHRFSAVFAQTHGQIWPPQQKTTFPSTSKEVQPDQQAQLREWFESTQVDQASPTLEEFLNVLNRWKDRIFKEAIGLRMGPLWNGLNTVKQKLQSRKKIYVMGNGPVADKMGTRIDADADAIIIRCNHFRQHTFEMTHGRRTDVQICNVHGAFSFADMEQWLDRDALIVVAEKGTSRARQQDYVHYLVHQGFSAFGVDEALHHVSTFHPRGPKNPNTRPPAVYAFPKVDTDIQIRDKAYSTYRRLQSVTFTRKCGISISDYSSTFGYMSEYKVIPRE